MTHIRGAIYVDGGYLRKILYEFKDSSVLKTDYRRMYSYIRSSMGAGSCKNYYYTSLPPTSDSRYAAEHRFCDMLDHQGIGVRVGHRIKDSRWYSKDRKKVEVDKATDTMLVLDFVRDVCRKEIDKAAIVAGDGDFYPVLEFAQKEGIPTQIWYYPLSDSTRASSWLLRYADKGGSPITSEVLLGWNQV